MTTRCNFLCASLLVLVFCSGAPSDEKQPGKQPDKNADQLADKNAETVTKALAVSGQGPERPRPEGHCRNCSRRRGVHRCR